MTKLQIEQLIEMAKLAQDSYENNDSKIIGYEVINQYKSEETGFQAVLYKNNSNNKKILAISGTDLSSFQDIKMIFK